MPDYPNDFCRQSQQLRSVSHYYLTSQQPIDVSESETKVRCKMFNILTHKPLLLQDQLSRFPLFAHAEAGNPKARVSGLVPLYHQSLSVAIFEPRPLRTARLPATPQPRSKHRSPPLLPWYRDLITAHYYLVNQYFNYFSGMFLVCLFEFNIMMTVVATFLLSAIDIKGLILFTQISRILSLPFLFAFINHSIRIRNSRFGISHICFPLHLEFS